ncbi:leucine-rich repeat domain-containing protein [Cohnella suwonensis]|uniref:Leucine-rich repeat domain-containing protein n=1 Tax=Cohnella suwonensis TaxID=696072 RepID=A0ABW0LYS6_9BACL
MIKSARMFRMAIMIVIAVLITPLLSNRFVHASDIQIEDPAVEKAIRDDLHLQSGSITQADLDKVEYLQISERRVKSLNGLEHAVNLIALSASDNEIVDLAPLSSLTKLNQLDLQGNQVEDVSPLSGVKSLQYLYLDDNRIRQIDGLANLDQVLQLGISSNFIDRLDAIRSMKSLYKLMFDDNNVSDLAPLLDAARLKSFSASENLLDLSNEATKSVLESLRQRDVAPTGDITKQKEAPSDRKATDPLLLKWSEENTGVHNIVALDFAYGNGIYVTSLGNRVQTSKDGITWQDNPVKLDLTLYTIAWGNGQFVALGNRSDQRIKDTALLTSKDGVNWTDHGNLKGIYNATDIAWNGKRYVAVTSTRGGGKIYSSEDGVKWTERSGLPTAITAVEWGNGTFVAQAIEDGVVAVSKDGVAWKKIKTNQPNHGNSLRMAFGGGKFVSVGDKTIMVSQDGVKWKHVSYAHYWMEIHWVKDRFFLNGFDYVDGRQLEGYAITATSKNGTDWTNASILHARDEHPFFVLHNGKQYVLMSHRGIQASKDGAKWTQMQTFRQDEALYDAAVGNGQLLMVGGDASVDMDKYHVMTALRLSSSGSWSGTNTKAMPPMNNVLWTGEHFLGVGYRGSIMTSKDGVRWASVPSPTKETLTKIIQAGDTFYATGTNGLIMSSKDEKNWTKKTTNATTTINSIAWNGHTFVAVGNKGLLLVSQDGNQWSKMAMSYKNNFYDIVWGKDNFVMTTSIYYLNERELTILRSPDGQHWEQSTFESEFHLQNGSTGLYGISLVGDYYIATGAWGSVYLSEDAEHWFMQPKVTNADLNYAIEYKGKVYVMGAGGTVISADLNSAAGK